MEIGNIMALPVVDHIIFGHDKYFSFYEYMQAPCGRLLVKVVLTDLEKKEAYRELKKLKAPLKQRLHDACIPKKTVIYTAKTLEQTNP